MGKRCTADERLAVSSCVGYTAETRSSDSRNSSLFLRLLVLLQELELVDLLVLDEACIVASDDFHCPEHLADDDGKMLFIDFNILFSVDILDSLDEEGKDCCLSLYCQNFPAVYLSVAELVTADNFITLSNKEDDTLGRNLVDMSEALAVLCLLSKFWTLCKFIENGDLCVSLLNLNSLDLTCDMCNDGVVLRLCLGCIEERVDERETTCDILTLTCVFLRCRCDDITSVNCLSDILYVHDGAAEDCVGLFAAVSEGNNNSRVILTEFISRYRMPFPHAGCMVLHNKVTLTCNEVPHLGDCAVFLGDNELVERVECIDNITRGDDCAVLDTVAENCSDWNFFIACRADYKCTAVCDEKLTVELGNDFLTLEVLIECISLTDVLAVLDKKLGVVTCYLIENLCNCISALTREYSLPFLVDNIKALVNRIDDDRIVEALFVARNGCNTTGMERTHGKLCTRLSN